MSNVYNLEPQPTAKVILHTTAGDLALELFAQQTPVTSRNFLQLCLDGYYDDTIFHRVVPGFCIQGGDPTGTGSGGQSSLDGGASFQDEFHSRLKFNRRGLLGMANTGTKDDNGSQFFLTLGKTEELNGKNTMFGRIEGNTIFNLVKIGEAELVEGEDSDRPLYPTKITTTELLLNPFEDMVRRKRFAAAETTDKTLSSKRKATKKKSGKQMLSFGDDEQENDGSALPIGLSKYNPKLINATKKTAIRPSTGIEKRNASASSTQILSTEPVVPDEPTSVKIPARTEESSESDVSDEPEPKSNRREALLARTNEHIASLQKSLRRDHLSMKTEEPKAPRSALEAMMPSNATRGRKRKDGADGDREDKAALDELLAFQKRLQAAPPAKSMRIENSERPGGGSGVASDSVAEDAIRPPVPAAVSDPDDEAPLCDLHFIPNCQSCQQWDQLDAEEKNTYDKEESLFSHALSFAKDRLGKDLKWKEDNEKELLVIDPRAREKEIREGKKKSKRKT